MCDVIIHLASHSPFACQTRGDPTPADVPFFMLDVTLNSEPPTTECSADHSPGTIPSTTHQQCPVRPDQRRRSYPRRSLHDAARPAAHWSPPQHFAPTAPWSFRRTYSASD